jgi:hypothetical protein
VDFLAQSELASVFLWLRMTAGVTKEACQPTEGRMQLPAKGSFPIHTG